MENNKEKIIIEILKKKSKLKQQVFENTHKTFKKLKKVLKEIAVVYNEQLIDTFSDPIIVFKDINNYQAELKVAGDVLVFSMHSNIFEFDRDHGVWQISYVQNNEMSTFSGIINIYNFLSDSFKYKRGDDLGYLVGRIFINKELNFFVEGKRQMGLIHNNFGHETINRKALKDIVETAIQYSLGFDLLVPRYEDAMVITVDQIQEKRKKHIKTGKRLGFGFNSDDVNGEKLIYTGG